MSKFPPLNTIPLYHSSLGALEQPGEVNITAPTSEAACLRKGGGIRSISQLISPIRNIGR